MYTLETGAKEPSTPKLNVLQDCKIDDCVSTASDSDSGSPAVVDDMEQASTACPDMGSNTCTVNPSL